MEARQYFVEACLGEDPATRDWYEKLIATCEEVVRPNSMNTDSAAVYPHTSVRALAEIGTLGLFIPRDLGGLGFGIPLALLTIETIASYCPSTAAIVLFHYQVVERTLHFADASFRDDDLRAFASGAKLGASAWSEPDAGADKSNISSYGVCNQDGTVTLHGAKSFCTGLQMASVLHVLTSVRSGAEKGPPSLVRICSTDVGFEVTDLTPMMGLRGTTTGAFRMDAVIISQKAVLGGVGAGPQLMARNYATGLSPGLLAMGIANETYEMLTQYISPGGGGFAKRRFELTRQVLATNLIQIESLYWVLAGILQRPMQQSRQMEFMKFKALATQIGKTVTNSTLNAFGAGALSTGLPLERMARDALTTALMGPTNEMVYEKTFSTHFPAEASNA